MSVHAPALKCGVTANIALQASYALWAVAPFSGAGGGGGLAASCAHDVRLQAVTNVSRFARLMRRRNAAITGGIAVAYYKEMPDQLVSAIEATLTPDMEDVCKRFAVFGG